jgi:hypothetical protein
MSPSRSPMGAERSTRKQERDDFATRVILQAQVGVLLGKGSGKREIYCRWRTAAPRSRVKPSRYLPTVWAGSVHSLHLRELRVREEQAAIHRPFDHCVDAALCINGSNAQKAGFAKSELTDTYKRRMRPYPPCLSRGRPVEPIQKVTQATKAQ